MDGLFGSIVKTEGQRDVGNAYAVQWIPLSIEW